MTRNRLLLTLVVVMGMFTFAVLDTNYTARLDLAKQLTIASRAACRRGLADRHDNAQAWYLAYLARREDASTDAPGSPRRRADRNAANLYLASATDLNSRTYGKYSVMLDGHPPTLPLGAGKLNCNKAIPFPHVSFFHLG